MSIEKDRNVRIETNILNFPKADNPELKEQRLVHAKLVQSICQKMDHDHYDTHYITTSELNLLANHGETIEFPKHISARLVSVLATQLNQNSFMEDLLWEKKEKVMFL